MTQLYYKKGFTVIELIVVIVVMGILSTFVVVQINRGQLVARDKERENDVKIIADTLERIYQTGQVDGAIIPSENPAITSAVPLNYPSYRLTIANNAQTKAVLGSIEPEALKSPFGGGLVSAQDRFGVVYNTAGGVTIGPNSVEDLYVYQPLRSVSGSDQLCLKASSIPPAGYAYDVISPRSAAPGFCQKFNIYYYSESTDSIKFISSKNSNVNSL